MSALTPDKEIQRTILEAFFLSLLSWLKSVNAKFYDRTSGGSGGAGGGVPNLMEKVRGYNRRKKFGQHWYRQTLICDGGDKIMT